MNKVEKLNVPIAKTSLLLSEIESVLEPLKSGWLVQGKHVAAFEKKWSHFTGAQRSIAVTSCTSGLHLSAVALGLKPGDEVIVPAFTWISTANVVEHQGAKPVFCDINLDTFNIDTTKIEELVTDKTVGIIPVHLFGLAADMDAILDLAKKYNLWVIEDAACGFGAIYKGKHVGSFGDAGVFSFHPRKSITTGEGGMVTSNHMDLLERIQQLRDHGAVLSDLQRHLGAKPYLLSDHIHAGYNQRMTDIQGSLGSAQMDRAAEILRERRRIASIYDDELAEVSRLTSPHIPLDYEHGYQSYPCMFMLEEITPSNITAIQELRNKFMEKLQCSGVSTRPATHAVHKLKFYREKYCLEENKFINAHTADSCSISLPLFHGMTDDEIGYVISQIKKLIVEI